LLKKFAIEGVKLMKKSKVAIIRCESYDEQVVLNSVRKGIDLIGGIDKFVKKDEKICT
jgi:uncharacterized protein (DUF362 family)